MAETVLPGPSLWPPGQLSDRWLRWVGPDQLGCAAIFAALATWATEILVVTRNPDGWQLCRDAVDARGGWLTTMAPTGTSDGATSSKVWDLIIADGLTVEELAAQQMALHVGTDRSGPWAWFAVNLQDDELARLRVAGALLAERVGHWAECPLPPDAFCTECHEFEHARRVLAGDARGPAALPDTMASIGEPDHMVTISPTGWDETDEEYPHHDSEGNQVPWVAITYRWPGDPYPVGAPGPYWTWELIDPAGPVVLDGTSTDDPAPLLQRLVDLLQPGVLAEQ